MTSIEITDSNYMDYRSLDIVAFAFAQSGAMGEPGGVEIVDAQGKFYHTNYCWEGIDYEHLLEIVPALRNCEFGILGHQAPEGWAAVYLGMGNHLTIRIDYYSQFEEEVRNRRIERPGELYQQWSEIVLKLLGKSDEN